jgi:putative hemolysin
METQDFINVRRLIAGKNPKLLKWLPGFIVRYLERIVHQEEINRFIRNNPGKRNADFCKAVIDYIGISYTISGLENVPESGKCVLVMNHPLGGMDAMILVDALRTRRTDLKFIVNDLLLQLEPLQDIFVGVNKHGKTSNENMNRINDLFASEQCVCIFPAGLVSRKRKGIIRDLTWKKTFVRLSKANDQTIVPIHIDGKLSKFFYRLSNLRRFLGIKINIEMLYLADELFRQKGQTIGFTIGKPIAASSLDSSKSDAEWSEWFRQHVYTLK